MGGREGVQWLKGGTETWVVVRSGHKGDNCVIYTSEMEGERHRERRREREIESENEMYWK